VITAGRLKAIHSVIVLSNEHGVFSATVDQVEILSVSRGDRRRNAANCGLL